MTLHMQSYDAIIKVLCLDHVTGGFLFEGMSDDDEDFQSVSLSNVKSTFHVKDKQCVKILIPQTQQ